MKSMNESNSYPDALDVNKLLHPESLHRKELHEILRKHYIDVSDNIPRSKLIEIFKKVALPLPQRMNDSVLKKKLIPLDSCSQITVALEKTSIVNKIDKWDNKGVDKIPINRCKRIKLNRLSFEHAKVFSQRCTTGSNLSSEEQTSISYDNIDDKTRRLNYKLHNISLNDQNDNKIDRICAINKQTADNELHVLKNTPMTNGLRNNDIDDKNKGISILKPEREQTVDDKLDLLKNISMTNRSIKSNKDIENKNNDTTICKPKRVILKRPYLIQKTDTDAKKIRLV